MKFVDASLLRKAILYLAALAAAAFVVFLATYLLGRNPSLEAELERLTTRRPTPDPGRAGGIPSLQPAEVPPEAPPAPPDPGGEPLGAGLLVSRSPAPPAGMVIVADVPALAPVPGDELPSFAGGLVAFLTRPPAGLPVGLRALAGAAGECGSTAGLLAPGQPGGGLLAAALDGASSLSNGPRNAAGAVAAAAEDLSSVAGERCVVVLAGGEEGCSADLCGADLRPGSSAGRVHVLLLAPRMQPGADMSLPDAGSAGSVPPVFDPDWAAPYRCLAERNGGTVATVASPAELERELRRIAVTLESSVVVRGFHYAAQEIKGVSPGGDGAWGATLRPGNGARGGAIESGRYPAVFAVPPGVHLVKARYAGQERTAAVAVASGERAEVRVTFVTGELFLQSLDAAGREIVGDSTGFRCAWGVEVFAGGGEEEEPVARTCSFPARLELAPGTYRLHAHWKGNERVLDEVSVEAGASSVRTVTFGGEED